MQLIDARLDGGISMDSLATECGLSRSYFNRAFHASFGQPPHRWLIVRRVERAKKALRDSSGTLAEIATSSGFADQSHFSRVFSAVTGLLPGT